MINISSTVSLVAGFILNFEKNFQEAPIEERKVLICKVISDIIVDGEELVVKFYVRRVPAVTPELEEMLQNRKAPIKPVSADGRPG